MAVFKKFEGSNASRYNNSLHAAYHTAQLKQLQAVGEETLETMHVSGELFEGYAMTVDDLTERSMEAQASTSTGRYDGSRCGARPSVVDVVLSGSFGIVVGCSRRTGSSQDIRRDPSGL